VCVERVLWNFVSGRDGWVPYACTLSRLSHAPVVAPLPLPKAPEYRQGRRHEEFVSRLSQIMGSREELVRSICNAPGAVGLDMRVSGGVSQRGERNQGQPG
jgi:hypothetical protein